MTEKEIQKMCAKNNREAWKLVLFLALVIIGLAGIIYAIVMQMILCYQKFGFVISSENFFIPHISLLGYLGVIPLAVSYFVIR